jgi:hypothetical protein
VDKVWQPVVCHLEICRHGKCYSRSLGPCDDARGEQSSQRLRGLELGWARRPGGEPLLAVTLQARETDESRELSRSRGQLFCSIGARGAPRCSAPVWIEHLGQGPTDATPVPWFRLTATLLSGQRLELRTVVAPAPDREKGSPAARDPDHERLEVRYLRPGVYPLDL